VKKSTILHLFLGWFVCLDEPAGCGRHNRKKNMKTEMMEKEAAHEAVRARYGEIARKGTSCCGPSCGGGAADAAGLSRRAGYGEEELAAVPEGANLGLGCGNPQAIAGLKAGETVLDLGSGAGFDALLAARVVGPGGRVIGVDMTPEMLARARENARKAGVEQVEFRLGEIEHLPVADGTVDVVISNCVINLSPDKPVVFREAYRALKPGGRLAVADMVALAPVPAELKADWELFTGCVAGASPVDEIRRMLEGAGFRDIRIRPRNGSGELVEGWLPGRNLEDLVASATIEAIKPESEG